MMTAVAELILAGVAVLGALGAAGKFVWNKIERRFLLIDIALEECRKREQVSVQRRATHMLAIELLLQEVERLSPRKSRVLMRVKSLLDALSHEGD